MKKHNKFLYMLFSTILCFFVQTMVFSAINSTVKITGNAYARVDADVRITGFKVYSVSPDANSGYEEYSKNTISTNVNLPFEDSTVTYVLEVTNYGDEAGIYSISGLPDYLDYEIKNYTLGNKLCSSDDQCSYGIVSYVYLTIKWKYYVYENVSSNIVLNFDFRNVYSITYQDISNYNYPITIMDGEDLNINFIDDISNKINIYVDGTEIDRSTYSYNNVSGNLILNDVSGDLIVEKAESILLDGRTLTVLIKKFVDGTTDDTYSSEESNVTYIGFFENEIPNGYTKEEFLSLPSIVVSDDGRTKVYNDNGKIFYYSIDDIYANSDSYSLFRGYINLTELDILALDTSRVWSAQSMFDNLKSLKTLDLSNFNTDEMGHMQSMFSGMSSLTSIDLSKFDTSNVRTFGQMFTNCSSLRSLDVSNFSTLKATDMSSMFYGCSSLTSINLGNLDTTPITNMTKLFYQCNNLETIDISNFNTSNVTSMERMFGHCYALKNIYVGSGWDISNVTNSERMFGEDTNLLNFDINSVDITKAYVGYGGYLTSLNLSNSDIILNKRGGEVCIGSECFYNVGNDGITVKLLAKYNLYVGGQYDDANGIYTSYGNEATGLQDSSILGFKDMSGDIRDGVTKFSESAYWYEEGITYPKYVYNSNSKLYSYLENYKNHLTNNNVAVNEIRLLSYDELKTLGYSGNYANVPSWVYSSSYWLGSALDDNKLYAVSMHPGLSERDCTYDHSYGVRPVIEMNIDEVRKLLN